MATEDFTKRVDDERPGPPPLPLDGTRRVVPDQPLDGTRRVMGDEPPPSRVMPLGTLAPGHILLDQYEVVETLNPHETERPGIFVCRTPERKVVVKVAAQRYPPKPELWEKLPFLDHPNVLKVFEVRESNGLYYEVQQYCAAGSLKDWLGRQRFTPEWVMQQFVPQANEGLRYLHDQGIVHRDIKPANIYLREKHQSSPMVLGDFDISSMLASDRTSRDTKRNAGTWEYMPPEAFPRFVDASSGSKAARVTRTADYYSLGITMIELVLGTTSLHASDLPDLFDFYLSGGQIELPTKPPEFVRLLRGLLIRDRHKRWSDQEVDRWLKQNNTLADAQAILDDEYFSLRRAIVPYTIHYMHATDLPGLAEMIHRNPEEAIDDLIHSDRIVDWVGTVDMNIARAIDKDRLLWQSEPENCVFRCTMFLDRTRPFPIIGLDSVKTTKEWLDAVVKSGKGPDQIAGGPANFAQIRKLDSWLHLKPDAEPELGDRVGSTLWHPSGMRFEELAYIFDPTLPYSHELSALDNLRLPPEQRKGATTPREVVAQAYGDPEDWKDGVPNCYEQAMERWSQGFLAAWMRQRGLATLEARAKEAAEQLEEFPCAAFETYLRVLDHSIEPLGLEFEKADFVNALSVPYGAVVSVRLRYRGVGMGVPFASLGLAHARDGIRLEPLMINQRTGSVTFTVDSNYKMPVTRVPSMAAIDITGGNCKIFGERPVVRYRILPATERATQHVMLGALAGFITLGLARFVIGVVAPVRNIFEPINPDLQVQDTFRYQTFIVNYNARYFFALVLGFLILYAGYRVWLEALKRAEL
jgi:serine/threonine protein kinase